MSEPTTEAEQSAELAPEIASEGEDPSMEDILASIRKIIADDDQTMEISPPQPLAVSSGQSAPDLRDTETSAKNIEAAEVNSSESETEALMRDLNTLPIEEDENSVFKSMFNDEKTVASDDTISSAISHSDDEGELIDLDIEALLGSADDLAGTEDLDLSAALAADNSEDMPDEAVLEMPDIAMEDETPAIEIPDSVSGSQDDSLNNFLEPTTFDDAQGETDQEADNLFEELEGLLAEASPEIIQDDTPILEDLLADMTESEDTTNDVFDEAQYLVEANADEIVKPVIEPEAKKRGFAAGYAAAGFSAIRPKVKVRNAEEPVRSEVELKDAPAHQNLTDADDQLDQMLNGLVEDLESIENSDADMSSSDEANAQTETATIETVLDESDLTVDEADFLQTSLSTDEGDMDLVKSLMADLTDPDAEEELPEAVEQTVGGMESADLSTESNEIESESVVSDDIEEETSEESENILDDILDMSIEDELSGEEALPAFAEDAEDDSDIESFLEIPTPESKSSSVVTAEQIVEDEALNVAENMIISEDLNVPEHVEASLETSEGGSEGEDSLENGEFSLSDIAAEAEREAERMEERGQIKVDRSAVLDLDATSISPNKGEPAGKDPVFELNVDKAASFGLVGFGAAALGAGVVVAPRQNTETYEANQPVQREPLQKDIENTITMEKESADMAGATAQKDVILDDVTESASANAFASLNQLVEEKAITAERGDRIGDLVMEALRPMLKEWLDANLKTIVERAVQKEVKRIASGK
jgi:cell pole-organizing protein PopZ